MTQVPVPILRPSMYIGEDLVAIPAVGRDYGRASYITLQASRGKLFLEVRLHLSQRSKLLRCRTGRQGGGAG